MKEAIEKALEGGYDLRAGMKVPDHIGTWPELPRIAEGLWQYIVLDPLFWQALGKALGKGLRAIKDLDNGERHSTYENWWEFSWHRFIDHLASGKDAESFFVDLLTNNK